MQGREGGEEAPGGGVGNYLGPRVSWQLAYLGEGPRTVAWLASGRERGAEGLQRL